MSLKSWDFFCLDEGKWTFKELLEHLNYGEQAERSPQFQLPLDTLAKREGAAAKKAAKRLGAGFLPLKHRMRLGDRTISWYHGPLVPRALKGNFLAPLLPAAAADKLVLFDQDEGLFDVSYAAAWEIGRMVTLANTRIALQLFNWKRSHVHALHAARHLTTFGFHLPVQHPPEHEAGATKRQGLPSGLEDWFRDLSLLCHVPFTYLVPDERLLPPESLRFFTLDQQWLESLRDGAFSIGRVQPADVSRDAEHQSRMTKLETISGFLLRSEVVSGYPGLNIDAYGKAVPRNGDIRDVSHLDAGDYPTLVCLRRERLSPNVMLCLFQGDTRMVDIYLKPETLHFGLDPPDGVDVKQREPQTLIKKLRGKDGEQLEDAVAVPFSNKHPSGQEKDNRVVIFPDLAKAVLSQLSRTGHLPPSHLADGGPRADDTELNPAIFALEMVAGVELVRFVRRTGKPA